MPVAIRVLFSVALILGLVSGCHQNSAQSASEPAAERTTTAVSRSATDSAYELAAHPADSYSVGKKAAFTISIKPRGAYHLNQEFPTSVTSEVPKSIALEKPQLVKADAKLFSEQQIQFEVAFSASEAGEFKVTALVDFAVCTAKTCIPLRKNLPVSLKVN